MRNTSHLRPAVLAAGVALLISACVAGNGEATTTTLIPTATTEATVTTTMPIPTATTTTEAMVTTTEAAVTTTEAPLVRGVTVYFLLAALEDDEGGPFLVPVYRSGTSTDDPAMQAVGLLLAGPTAGETDGIPALSTAIPLATRVLGVSVENGVATVDFDGRYDDGGGSFSMFARLAQVIYTLTAIDGIDSVRFAIEGELVTVFSSEGIELDRPQTREDYYNQLPPIFVDAPAWGEPVPSPIQVSGLSNVFEAVSQVMLTDDDGAPLVESSVMATCGTGCWGHWDLEISYSVDREQFGTLIVWEYSARDGSRVNIREYPLWLGSSPPEG